MEKRKIAVVNELGEIKGHETSEKIHDPSNPQMHLSIALLPIKNNKEIGLRKNSFNDVFPNKYDFIFHDHVYEGEKVDEKINNMLLSFCNECKKKVIDFIYFYYKPGIISEYEYCKVVVMFLEKHNSIKNIEFFSIENIANKREDISTRAYGFINYHLPHVLREDKI